ncbi:hok/gef family protein, partial [Salmonella enterica]|nr:hok/gef family protein [Salmonella enterica]
MSQKPLFVITIFVVIILTFSMLHGSLCEVRMKFWG